MLLFWLAKLKGFSVQTHTLHGDLQKASMTDPPFLIFRVKQRKCMHCILSGLQNVKEMLLYESTKSDCKSLLKF